MREGELEKRRAIVGAGLEAIDQAREWVWTAQAAANSPAVDGMAQDALDLLCAMAAHMLVALPSRHVDGSDRG